VLSIVGAPRAVGRLEDSVMSVQIAPGLEAKIRDKVETGGYADADAVAGGA
jgi:hypothetical protein